MIKKCLAVLMLFCLIAFGGVAQDETWREVAADNLVLLTTEFGTTALELNPDFAPNHAKRFRDMVRAGELNGVYFYRVIDGFVAQTGPNGKTSREWTPMQNENDRALRPLPFILAMAQDAKLNTEWLLHCPGAVALARDTDPDSGTTEFYIALDAQRYLDRNLTIFARVIDGMEFIQKVERGDRAVASGVIQAPRTGDKVISAQMASDMAEGVRPTYLVQKPGSGLFEGAKRAARVRTAEFFYNKPPEVIDICDFNVPVRRVGK